MAALITGCGKDEQEAEEAPSDAPPIGDYFSRMLGWQPGGGEVGDEEVDQP